MSDVGPEQPEYPRSERSVELRVAPRLENLAVVRTLVGAVGTFEDLDLDTVADLRLAIDELCTQLIRCAAPDSLLIIVIDPGDDDVVVQVSADCETVEALSPGGFSWFVLTSLADDVQTSPDRTTPDGRGGMFAVTLRSRRAGAKR
ncbi:MAG TPA: anti-sigma factor [Mycobacterium sp.]|nr:anti-sigma factor [Mycobacterium sp.]